MRLSISDGTLKLESASGSLRKSIGLSDSTEGSGNVSPPLTTNAGVVIIVSLICNCILHFPVGAIFPVPANVNDESEFSNASPNFARYALVIRLICDPL